jgi:DNA-binding XRE family transcriptional regulator
MKDWMDTQTAARRLQISVAALVKRRLQGLPPEYRKQPNGYVRYDRAVIEAMDGAIWKRGLQAKATADKTLFCGVDLKTADNTWPEGDNHPCVACERDNLTKYRLCNEHFSSIKEDDDKISPALIREHPEAATLKMERKRRRLKQSEFAAELGIKLTSYGRYERGVRSIPEAILGRVACARGAGSSNMAGQDRKCATSEKHKGA